MSQITFNYSLCKKDHLCVKDCPSKHIIVQSDGFPAVDEDRNCIECGHCFAVCPCDALTLNGVIPESQPKADNKNLEWAKLENLVKSRRSVRQYQNKTIPSKTIDKLLDVTRWAPTGGNSQLVNWVFVEKSETMKQISRLVVDWARPNENMKFLADVYDAGYDIVLRGAPHLAIAYAGDGYGSTPADCIIAATTLELAASSQGVGACWAGFFMMACSAGFKPLLDILELPQDNKVHAALMMGYPLYKYNRVPQRKELRLKKI